MGKGRNLIQRTKGKLIDAISDVLPDRLAIQLGHYRALKRLADLKNPRTLNEKIQWRKLHEHDPRLTTFSDKIAAKVEVAKLVGPEHVIENLWVGTNPEEIPWDELKPPYVIKTNHSSGCNLFVRRGDVVDREAITRELKKQLRFDHSHKWREWAYKNIKRGILIERMLDFPAGNVAANVRFFVYHGKARYLYVVVNSNEMGKPTIDYFDIDWNPLDVCEVGFPRAIGGVERPANLDKAVAIAEKIAAEFDFVRMDMYLVDDRIYFGEATFYPCAGVARQEPSEWGLRFGEPWKIEHGRRRVEPEYVSAPSVGE
jgi:hypothetical protein